ncbi:type II toxin-antitoxin system RelE/ParE family toxin [Spirosoma sp. HMF3257]|uniref:Type II toxin-antitoxin system RelE/ParE family toxin n=1 Tax=Spirosoma telluris TaxID=2183553 RepID=A0A327NMD1_9BACT|nr:type II toxin-antitoxin system RelE/ParE family toxin [Spirosoma telluris]RAI76591.1 type II toxin-antitoxin system RelE/ParE family toxin [Spirosoma telluris]
MAYQLSFSDKALKSLKRIPRSDNERIIAALEELAKDPDSKPNVKRLNNHAEAIFRLRVGNYRVLYDKYDALRIIAVIDVGHRKDIYE